MMNMKSRAGINENALSQKGDEENSLVNRRHRQRRIVEYLKKGVVSCLIEAYYCSLSSAV